MIDTSSSSTNTFDYGNYYYSIRKGSGLNSGQYYYHIIKTRGHIGPDKPPKQKTSKKKTFLFDPTGIGEEWPKKKK